MTGHREGIDWDDVRRRLAESERALERALDGDPVRLDAAYRRRAERLAARRTEAAPAAEESVPVLAFGIGAERYGLPLRDLEAVLPFANCTPVPGGVAELLGVTNVRGAVRSVLDLRRLLGLPEGPAGGAGYILLVRHGDQVVGLRVDSLEKAVRVATGSLVAAAEPLGRYVKGLTPDRVIVLDAGAVLDHPAFHPPGP
jgi:purine-binding chemotaxis protein CheW